MELHAHETGDITDLPGLVRHIAALANTAGGTITFEMAQIPDELVESLKSWDDDTLAGVVNAAIVPEELAVTVQRASDHSAVTVTVPRFSSPPLVLLPAHEVVVIGGNGRIAPAQRPHYVRWRQELRDRVGRQVQMVLEAPETAWLRVIDESEVRDESSYFLSRALQAFRQRPEQLLKGDDLLHLFRNRSSIDYTTSGVAELLIHSALRRRATLFFWLAFTHVDAGTVERVLFEALAMSDRDKSDMGGVAPLVAALYLDEGGYDQLITKMQQSRYAHIVEASSEFPSWGHARESIVARRLTKIDNTALLHMDDIGILGAAHGLAQGLSPGRTARRMPNLGLEFLVRRLNPARRSLFTP